MKKFLNTLIPLVTVVSMCGVSNATSDVNPFQPTVHTQDSINLQFTEIMKHTEQDKQLVNAGEALAGKNKEIEVLSNHNNRQSKMIEEKCNTIE